MRSQIPQTPKAHDQTTIKPPHREGQDAANISLPNLMNLSMNTAAPHTAPSTEHGTKHQRHNRRNAETGPTQDQATTPRTNLNDTPGQQPKRDQTPQNNHMQGNEPTGPKHPPSRLNPVQPSLSMTERQGGQDGNHVVTQASQLAVTLPRPSPLGAVLPAGARSRGWCGAVLRRGRPWASSRAAPGPG